jgi:curved DNA-binding protein CbpA
MRDFYTVLGVAPKASDTEIKAAFRNLAKICHPDVKPGDPEADRAFQEARRAYRFLSNPVSRKIYDDFLAQQRASSRQRIRRAATTMTASFVLTAVTGLLVLAWLQQGGVLIDRLSAQAPERTGAVEMARAQAPGADEAAEGVRAAGRPAVRR